ncbi:MAG: outer membrane lipoprotein chaperone LolA [Pseudomonadota bacterium]
MLKKYYFILLILCTNSFAGSDALDVFFSQTSSLKANFNQSIMDHNGKIIETSSGQLIINRPHQFVLNYTKPDQQRYISDGKTLWIYDVELEQVTIKAVDENFFSSPVLLLSSDKNIKDVYHINETIDYDAPEKDVFNLTAKVVTDESNNMFKNIQLIFLKHQLVEIIMQDNFEQTTRLTLYNQQVNTAIDSDTFSFIIPFGVDVIGTQVQ